MVVTLASPRFATSSGSGRGWCRDARDGSSAEESHARGRRAIAAPAGAADDQRPLAAGSRCSGGRVGCCQRLASPTGTRAPATCTQRRTTADRRVAHPRGRCHGRPADAVVVAGTGERDDARAPEPRPCMRLRRRWRPHEQRSSPRVGLGRSSRRRSAPAERADRLALHPVRSKRRLPRILRRPHEARRNPPFPRESRHPDSRGAIGRPGRGAHRVRTGQAEGRAARARCPWSGRAPGRRSLPRGGRTRRPQACRGLGERKHACRCWSSRDSPR